VPRGEATNTNFIVFSLTRLGFDPTIYRTQGKHANHYATDVVCGILRCHHILCGLYGGGVHIYYLFNHYLTNIPDLFLVNASMFSENHILLNIFPIWFQGKLEPMVVIRESFYPLNTFQLCNGSFNNYSFKVYGLIMNTVSM
jgi:hypothetical protein